MATLHIICSLAEKHFSTWMTAYVAETCFTWNNMPFGFSLIGIQRLNRCLPLPMKLPTLAFYLLEDIESQLICRIWIFPYKLFSIGLIDSVL